MLSFLPFLDDPYFQQLRKGRSSSNLHLALFVERLASGLYSMEHPASARRTECTISIRGVITVGFPRLKLIVWVLWSANSRRANRVFPNQSSSSKNVLEG